MKLRLPKRRVWRVAIYLGALLLIAIAIDLVIADARRTIRPGYLTTRIVEPRLPDGSIDYATAVDQHFGRGVTPENNAAVALLQVLGRRGPLFAILCSDHGTAYGEDGYFGHRIAHPVVTTVPYAEVIR